MGGRGAYPCPRSSSHVFWVRVWWGGTLLFMSAVFDDEGSWGRVSSPLQSSGASVSWKRLHVCTGISDAVRVIVTWLNHLSRPFSLPSYPFLPLLLFFPFCFPPSSLPFRTKGGHSPTNLISSEAICAGSQRARPKTNRDLRSVENTHSLSLCRVFHAYTNKHSRTQTNAQRTLSYQFCNCFFNKFIASTTILSTYSSTNFITLFTHPVLLVHIIPLW